MLKDYNEKKYITYSQKMLVSLLFVRPQRYDSGEKDEVENMELISKAELVKEYEVNASFYRLKFDDKVFDCRNRAIIRRIGVNQEYYDAVFILVNPGSCHPEMQDSIQYKNPLHGEIPLIGAESDSTQCQIMRLMKLREWKQVCIINLSDLCSGNLDNFKSLLEDAKRLSYTYHSIFSKERSKELNQIIHANKGPFIVGWGTKDFIKPLANKALQSHSSVQPVVGWQHNIKPFYYHPNQRLKEGKIEWLQRLNTLLA